MAKDKDYRALINTTRWQRLRRDALSAHPLCSRCQEEGRLAAASEVHHIRPVEEATSRAEKERLMFSPANLRCLCHGCHVATHTEMGRCGKAANRERNERKLTALKEKFFGAEADGENREPP